jgi:phenylacetate-CoA ligase
MSGQSLRASSRDRSEPIEGAGLDELRTLQLARLKEALARAVLVPQYRKKFAEAGIAPGDLKHLDDLRGFPFTTKEDLRPNYPFGMFAVPMTEIVRIHASNGTTGKPTVVGYTRGEYGRR